MAAVIIVTRCKDTIFCIYCKIFEEKNSIFCTMGAKNDISARFIEAYEALLASGKVSDKRDFAAKLNISASMVTEISKGRSSVGTQAVQNIVFQFNICAEWLLTGRGEMLTSGEVTDTPSASTSSDVENKLLRDLLADKDIIIRQQAEEIGQLRERLEQATRRLEKIASDAHTSDIANAG